MSPKMHLNDVNPYYAQAVDEHERLHASVERIRKTLDECCAADATAEKVAKAVALVADLRGRLERHFEQEEAGGYLEEALTHAPQLTGQAEKLQRQHAEFLDLANGMLEHARRDAAPSLVWADLKSDYAALAKRLCVHEAAENALLARAFNVDPGTAL